MSEQIGKNRFVDDAHFSEEYPGHEALTANTLSKTVMAAASNAISAIKYASEEDALNALAEQDTALLEQAWLHGKPAIVRAILSRSQSHEPPVVNEALYAPISITKSQTAEEVAREVAAMEDAKAGLGLGPVQDSRSMFLNGLSGVENPHREAEDPRGNC